MHHLEYPAPHTREILLVCTSYSFLSTGQKYKVLGGKCLQEGEGSSQFNSVMLLKVK